MQDSTMFSTPDKIKMDALPTENQLICYELGGGVHALGAVSDKLS